MKLERYTDPMSFGADVLDLLLEHEVQNNLPVSFVRNEHGLDTGGWWMATVKDDAGSVLLTAVRTPPHNLVLFETRNRPDDAALRLLSDTLRAEDPTLPGVLAERSLARRFAAQYAGEGRMTRHMAMNIMQLDRVADIPRAPGHSRPLREDDLFFAPYWAREFAMECRVAYGDIPTHTEQLRQRIGNDTHWFWEDPVPVAQAAHGRSTLNGAVVNAVYTPPHYRNRGYASSVVADLSGTLLERGYRFCCLFADADNPVSCGIYRRIGYADQCVMEEWRFGRPPA